MPQIIPVSKVEVAPKQENSNEEADSLVDHSESENEEKIEQRELKIDGHDSDSDSDNVTTRPSMSMAKQTAMKARPSVYDASTGEWTLLKYNQFRTKDFQQFGVGIYLYFKFLKQLSCLFFFLFCLFLPAFLSYITANNLDETSMKFEQSTVGNLGDAYDYPRIKYPSQINGVLSSILSKFADYDSDDQSLNKKDASWIFAWFDLFATLCFLIFLVFCKWNQKREARATEDANITVGDYSVRVTGLPSDCYNREEIQHHFDTKNGFGKVVDVAIAYNDTGIIRKYLDKSDKMEHVTKSIRSQVSAKKLKKAKKKVNKIGITLNKKKRKYDKRCIAAYVTFNDPQSVADVIHAYPDTFLARCCMKKKLRFQNKYKLKVHLAPEPSEIIYDNMRYSKCNVFWRRILTFILSQIVIAMSCGMSLGAASYRQSHLKTAESDDGCQMVDGNVIEELESENSEYSNDCLCSQIDYSDMYDMRKYCQSYITELAVSNALMGASSMMIIFVNFGLKFVSRILVNFEKHISLTKMERQLTWKMFIGMFFNTALIMLAVNAKFGAYDLLFLFKGTYNDFTPEWYQVVGITLLLTMCLNAFNPHILAVVTYPFSKLSIWCKIRKASKTTGVAALTQRELNTIFRGYSFTLAERYAIICNTIYVSFFYASGMPVLLLLASITFCLTYLCDKFALLKRCEKPNSYNSDIAQFSLGLIKPVIYMHLAVSIWVYGSDTIFRQKMLTNDTGYNTSIGKDFQHYVLNWACFPIFLALLVLVAFDVLTNILTTFRLTQCFVGFIKRILLCICPCICRKCIVIGSRVHIQEDIDLFINELQSGVKFDSYLVSEQRTYTNAYFDEEMAKDTKGLLIQEKPLYVKQNFWKQSNKQDNMPLL